LPIAQLWIDAGDVKRLKVITSTDAVAFAAVAAATLRAVVRCVCPLVMHVIRDTADDRAVN